VAATGLYDETEGFSERLASDGNVHGHKAMQRARMGQQIAS
jgi:hypothetical protein